nr:heme exporter protein CcmD [Sulfitobacter guttiformis]
MPDLGKYAAEVLGAYGVTLLLLAGLVIVTLRRGRKARAALKKMEQETARDVKN